MIKNTETDYGVVTKVFHWGMVVIIVSLVIAGLIMTELKPGDLKWQFYGLHKATGMVVFGLALLRIIWRWINPVPKLEENLPSFIKWSATNNIRLLYILMFLYPTSGFLMSTLGGHPIDFYGLYTIKPLAKNPAIAKQAHFLHTYILEYLLFFSFGAHVVGALYHHFVLKDQTLKKIL